MSGLAAATAAHRRFTAAWPPAVAVAPVSTKPSEVLLGQLGSGEKLNAGLHVVGARSLWTFPGPFGETLALLAGLVHSVGLFDHLRAVALALARGLGPVSRGRLRLALLHALAPASVGPLAAATARQASARFWSLSANMASSSRF